jgi:hypothetical protein
MACLVFENMPSSRASSPLASLSTPEPSLASLRLCIVPHGCYRPCSDDQRFIEHLAGIRSAFPLLADRPPQHPPSRRRPSRGLSNRLAQLSSLSLSFYTCPMLAHESCTPRHGVSHTRAIKHEPERLKPSHHSPPRLTLSPHLSSPSRALQAARL